MTTKLQALAIYLDEHGFEGLADAVREYIADSSGWSSDREFLRALAADVWYGWRHVGESDERDIYVACAVQVSNALG